MQHDEVVAMKSSHQSGGKGARKRKSEGTRRGPFSECCWYFGLGIRKAITANNTDKMPIGFLKVETAVASRESCERVS